ncbi:hypothetical protein F4802DRAFT_37074 [Xylaria palmicola]|nr:hypothetical protein F4802DRAFT_37074 [Xylaria palmicola]
MADLLHRSVMAMARPPNRKRHWAGDPSQEQPPTKKIRSKRKYRSPLNFSPGFWDHLSKVWLTPRALRELDRRNNPQPLPTEPSAPTSGYSIDLARFARHGGPDLHHLRGHPEPAQPMASSRSSASRSRRTQDTQSTPGTSLTSEGRSSAYNKVFEQHLIDNQIYPEGYDHPDDRPTPRPNNFGPPPSTSRPSLPPSRFSESAFQNFKKQNRQAVFENDVMADVIPVICGDTDIPNKRNVLFTELKAITTADLVKPKPDFFDGAHLQNIDEQIRDKDDHQSLYSSITPSKHPSIPVAPNFFLEAKGPDGSAAVAQRQACYDGAYGARAMHSLQNYGEEEPAYDGNAYAYSSTYHAGTGTLQLYAHYVTAPIAPDGRPEYHMTQLDGYYMTGKRQTFVEGATAFRNLRDEADDHRKTFIAAANAKVRRSREVPTAIVQQDDARVVGNLRTVKSTLLSPWSRPTMPHTKTTTRHLFLLNT